MRTLLPAVGSSQPRPSQPRSASVRQNVVLAACDACRTRKTKCSGGRPSCRRCLQRHIQCKYSTQPGETKRQALKRKYASLNNDVTDHEELFDLLRTLPEPEARDILKRIRSDTDVSTILSHVKAGNVLIQMAVSPETRFRYQLPYLSEMPEVYIPNNPYLDSLIYESASLFANDSERNSYRGQSPRSPRSRFPEEYQSLYLKPFHAAQVVDPILSDAKISRWTSVCDDDSLMRHLLEHWFRCEYQFTAAFQKDDFLEDLAAYRDEFCSPLLVNIMLAYSCVCFPRFSDRSEYWNPHTWQYRFLAEAKRLWELDASTPKITTIQAGILFNVFYNLCGLDEVGQVYRIQAVGLAQKLGLYDNTVTLQDSRAQRGRSYAAWALYNWETLVGFSFMLAPLLKQRPDLPLPDPLKDERWYGEIWLKYPLTHGLSPAYFGQTFRARCQFRIIMNEFCQMAYTKDSAVSLANANRFRLRLQDWYENLPEPLLPRRIVLPGHLQLHIYYHHLILTMYEPLLKTKTDREPTPYEIVAESSRNIQTLVRLYYLRHGFEAMDLFIVIPLMLAASECIDAINEQTPLPKLEVLRSTLILAAKGLCSQRRNHYLGEALFRVIRGRMRPREVALLKENMDFKDEDIDEKREMAQAVRSHWPVSVVKNMEEMDSHILTNLVESYAHLNVNDDPDKNPATS